MPAVPAVTLPGRLRAWSMYSCRLRAGMPGPTTSTVGLLATVHSGRNERTTSNFTRPWYSAGIMLWLVAPNSRV